MTIPMQRWNALGHKTENQRRLHKAEVAQDAQTLPSHDVYVRRINWWYFEKAHTCYGQTTFVTMTENCRCRHPFQHMHIQDWLPTSYSILKLFHCRINWPGSNLLSRSRNKDAIAAFQRHCFDGDYPCAAFCPSLLSSLLRFYWFFLCYHNACRICTFFSSSLLRIGTRSEMQNMHLFSSFRIFFPRHYLIFSQVNFRFLLSSFLFFFFLFLWGFACSSLYKYVPVTLEIEAVVGDGRLIVWNTPAWPRQTAGAVWASHFATPFFLFLARRVESSSPRSTWPLSSVHWLALKTALLRMSKYTSRACLHGTRRALSSFM